MTKKVRPSALKRLYTIRFIMRCLTLVLCVVLYLFFEDQFDVLHGMNFFDSFSLLHIIWVAWLVDMFFKIFPIKTSISAGSVKHYKCNYKCSSGNHDKTELKKYVKDSSIRAYISMVLWIIMLTIFGVLYCNGIFDEKILFLISILFYVCDLVCVLFFCPFRILLNTRCCTTCRIFNWDSFLLVSPLIFVKGFYSYSIFSVAIIVFILWEVLFFTHPERFYEGTNDSLKCANCKDGLCRRDNYIDSMIISFFKKGK